MDRAALVRLESEKKLSITVYSKPRCPQCVATYRKLNGLGAPHESVDVSEDPEALSFIQSLGYSQAPVVVVKDARGAIVKHWSGFRPDLIKKEAGK